MRGGFREGTRRPRAFVPVTRADYSVLDATPHRALVLGEVVDTPAGQGRYVGEGAPDTGRTVRVMSPRFGGEMRVFDRSDVRPAGGEQPDFGAPFSGRIGVGNVVELHEDAFPADAPGDWRTMLGQRGVVVETRGDSDYQVAVSFGDPQHPVWFRRGQLRRAGDSSPPSSEVEVEGSGRGRRCACRGCRPTGSGWC
jgi:hypothetical protein